RTDAKPIEPQRRRERGGPQRRDRGKMREGAVSPSDLPFLSAVHVVSTRWATASAVGMPFGPGAVMERAEAAQATRAAVSGVRPRAISTNHAAAKTSPAPVSSRTVTGNDGTRVAPLACRISAPSGPRVIAP